MWLLLFLLLSNVQAQEKGDRGTKAPDGDRGTKAPDECGSMMNVKKCIGMMKSDKNYKPSVCDEGERACDGESQCPDCIPKMYKEFLETIKDKTVPDSRQCWVDGMIQKCKAAGVDLDFCDDDDDDKKPHCKRSEVSWEGTEEKPPQSFNISCPSCVPKEAVGHVCKERPTEKCGDDKPTMKWDENKKSLCPSCFKVEEEDDCSLEERKACLVKVKTLPKCGDRENPTKDDCCWSCKPYELPEGAEEKKEMVEKCMKKVKGLSECKDVPADGKMDDREDDDKVGSRDTDGCRSCAPPAPKRDKKEDKCTLEEVKECREDSPDCELEEKPLTDDESLRCCAPCIRPASKANLLRVIACRKFLKDCDDDGDDDDDAERKRNSFLPGEACPICGTKPPKCGDGCDDNKVCVRVRRNGTAVKRCVRKKRIKMILRLTAKIKKEIRQADKKTMTGVLKEFVQRYCEQNSEADRCAKSKEKLLDSLECVKKTNGTKERKSKDNVVEIEVEFGDEEETTSERRLLQSSSTEGLLSDATTHDTDYVEGGDVESPELNPDDSSASSPCIFFTTVLSVLAFSQF